VKIIAVDFDGTLCESAWPDIGKAHWGVINQLVKRQAEGDKIILWTCRTGKQLEEAVKWCTNHGIRFKAVKRRPYGDASS